MCLAVYLASDTPVEAIAWNEDAPAFYIEPVAAGEVVRKRFSYPLSTMQAHTRGVAAVSPKTVRSAPILRNARKITSLSVERFAKLSGTAPRSSFSPVGKANNLANQSLLRSPPRPSLRLLLSSFNNLNYCASMTPTPNRRTSGRAERRVLYAWCCVVHRAAVTLGRLPIEIRRRSRIVFGGINMNQTFTAVVKNDGEWWIGWVEEVPGVNCQERSRDELLKTLRVTLLEALEINRADARDAGGKGYEELSIVV